MRELITSTNLTAVDAPLWNTPERHGSVVSVVTWLLIIATVFVMLARLVTRYATIKTLRWDDTMAILAMVRISFLSSCHRRCLKPPLTRPYIPGHCYRSIHCSFLLIHTWAGFSRRHHPSRSAGCDPKGASSPRHEQAHGAWSYSSNTSSRPYTLVSSSTLSPWV